MWWNYSPEACEHILSSENIFKIIVDRPNRLASFASRMKAEATKIWNLPASDEVDDGYVDRKIAGFSPVEFLNYVRTTDSIFAKYRERARGPVLEISYEEILSGDAYQKCVAFLGVTAGHNEPKGYTKLNPSSILSRFVHADAPIVLDVLDEIGHPEWVFEGERAQSQIVSLVGRLKVLREERQHLDAERRRLDAERRHLSEALREAVASAEAARTATRAVEAARNSLLKAFIEAASVRANLEAECGRLNRHLHEVQGAHYAVLNSRSWRAMEPVRRFTTFARRVYHALRRRAAALAR